MAALSIAMSAQAHAVDHRQANVSEKKLLQGCGGYDLLSSLCGVAEVECARVMQTSCHDAVPQEVPGYPFNGSTKRCRPAPKVASNGFPWLPNAKPEACVVHIPPIGRLYIPLVRN